MEPYMNPIYPFTSQRPLPKEVESDHAPVAVRLPDGNVLMYYNISNPKHHHYFGQTVDHPFHDTHMNVPTPCDEDGNLKDPWLQAKVKQQIETIVEELGSGQVSIYVLVEAYQDFVKQLLRELPNDDIFHFEAFSLASTKRWSNKTVIIYDENRYKRLKFDVMEQEYEEEQNQGQKRKLSVPCIQLQNRLKHCSLTIAGVHVPGCASQHPKTGLETLAKMLKDVCRWWGSNVLAVGDYNTPPEGVYQSVIRCIYPPDFHVTYLTIPYDTHVNPNCKAGVYDHALWIQQLPRILPISYISCEGRALVQAIQQNYIPQF